MMQLLSLALFPLHAVLLPGATLSLRVFEPRYLDLVRECGRSGSSFGVCLIPESATSLALPGVVYKPITGLPSHAKVDLSCIYRNDDRSPILQAFLGVVDRVQLGLHDCTAG